MDLVRKTRTESRTKSRSTPARRRAAVEAPQRAVDLLVLSAAAALVYEPSGREVCISITDPGHARVELSPKFSDILRVSFSDFADPTPFPFGELFAVEHAGAIIAFVNRWTDVDRIVVHCLAGVSRSPAVALAIAELRGGPTDLLEQQFPMWNPWVRQLLVKAGQVGRSRRSRRKEPR